MERPREDFWENWRYAEVASRWGGEDWVTVEDLYQAFKKRMEAEAIAASSPDSGSKSPPLQSA